MLKLSDLAGRPDFKIGPLSVSPSRRRIEGPAGAIHLEPLVMQVFLQLIDAHGNLVTREQLFEQVWGEAMVGDDSLNRAIAGIRRISTQTASGLFEIETIPRTGYRLVFTNGAAHQVGGSDSSGAGLHRRDLLIGGGALGAIAAAAIGWSVVRGDGTPSEARLLIADARNSFGEGRVDEVDNAIGKLRQAVQIAPNSAEAWGMLAFAYMVSAQSAPYAGRPALRARGSAAARRALELHPQQVEALTAQILAIPQYRNWYNYELALRAVLARHPDDAFLNIIMAYQLSQVGRTSEALDYYDKGLTAFPLAPKLLVAQAALLWDIGRLDEAETAITKTYELMPRYYGIWFTKLFYLMYNGRAGEASTMIANRDSRPAGIPEWNYDLTATQVNALASSDRAEVMRTIKLWKTESARGTGFTENGAIFAGFAGDMDEAFRLLNALYFNRGFKMPDAQFSKEQGIYSGIERHTNFLFGRPIAPIRRDPRFGVLTRELGLDDYWRRTNSRSLTAARHRP